jgi:hypothetical protein
VQHDDKRWIVRKGRRPIDEHSQIAGIRSETEHLPQTCAALAGASGTTALQRPKELLPPTPVAGEAECLTQIYHHGSFPAAHQLIAAVHNARGVC